MDLEGRLNQARQNVDNLQKEFDRVSTLLTKWQGVVEWLQSVQAEEAEKGKAKKTDPS